MKKLQQEYKDSNHYLENLEQFQAYNYFRQGLGSCLRNPTSQSLIVIYDADFHGNLGVCDQLLDFTREEFAELTYLQNELEGIEFLKYQGNFYHEENAQR